MALLMFLPTQDKVPIYHTNVMMGFDHHGSLYQCVKAPPDGHQILRIISAPILLVIHNYIGVGSGGGGGQGG